MTRINVGIPVDTLSRQHLLAEHREIKRIPNAVKNGTAVLSDIPATFTLNKGHVRFFYDKLGYLLRRYIEIRDECYERNYAITDYSDAWDGLPEYLMNDWNPSADDVMLIRARMVENSLKKNGK